MAVFRDIAAVCRMIKIEHSIFALPFAFAAAFMAAGGVPSWRILVPLTVAMVAVRSFAMGYNRVADRDIDALNPRTKNRALVTGELSLRFTKRFLFLCAIVFTTACALLNETCLLLSPVALVWSAFYSHTKRFTRYSHFFLGSVDALAVPAGWLAVEPAHLGFPAVVLFCAVMLWVAGFDILYSCQDVEVDLRVGLHSIPAEKGVPYALLASSFCHACVALLFPLAGWTAGLHMIYLVVSLAIGCVLVWEHRLIRADDLSRLNTAFFTLNGVISVGLFLGVWVDLAFPIHL